MGIDYYYEIAYVVGVMIFHYQPPVVPSEHSGIPSFFLAGSIELNTCENWQKNLVEILRKSAKNAVIYNPRRDDWDNNISDAGFLEQVIWELDHLEKSDIKAFYFDPATKSPVTMIELGLMLASAADKCIVCSPMGFWRRKNLEITCSRYNVSLLSSFEDFVEEILGVL